MKPVISEDRAITSENQALISHHQRQLIDKMTRAIDNIVKAQSSSSKQEKNHIMTARELALDSCRHAFVVNKGLRVHIWNERSDGLRWRILDQASNDLYKLYCDCFNGTPTHQRKIGLQKILDNLKNID